MAQKREITNPEVLGLIGVGLDNQDGHKRLTESDEFIVLGGSHETHEQMQDAMIRFSETLKDSGKRLQDASVEEVMFILDQTLDS